MTTRETLVASGLVKPNPVTIARRIVGKAVCRRLEAILARRALVKGKAIAPKGTNA
jgi:hypothetical protein